MRHKEQAVSSITSVAMLCLAVTSVTSAASVAQNQSTDTQAAGAQPTVVLMLEQAVHPEGVSGPGDYDAYLASRLKELRSQADQAVTPRAYLELVEFALTQAVEPELSRAWLGLRQPSSEGLASTGLVLARAALDQARQLQERRGNGLNTESSDAEIHRFSVLIAMESVLLEQQGGIVEALQAARQGESLRECLAEPAQPVWNLLIAACLDKAGRHQDALLRLQWLLRDRQDAQVRLAATVLQSRMLAETSNHAAAVVLISEYLRESGFALETSTKDKEAGADASQREGMEGSNWRTAMCTLLYTKAGLLADWTHQLRKSNEPYGRQAACMLESESIGYLAQVEVLGPYLVRLLPVLARLQ